MLNGGGLIGHRHDVFLEVFWTSYEPAQMLLAERMIVLEPRSRLLGDRQIE
jgi:hypothetical protein